MDKTIERIVRDNPLLDGAEVITTTITREDRTKAHYYIFKMIGDTIDSRTFIPIPFDVVTKINGKGRNSHYIAIAVLNDGYVVINLNKTHKMNLMGLGKIFGISYDEADEVVRFPKKKDFFEEMEEITKEIPS